MIRIFKIQLNISITFILYFFPAITAHAQVIQDSSYFPLAIGNQWIYTTIDSIYTDTTAVIDTQRVEGNLYYGLSYYSGYPFYIWFRKENEKVYIVDTLAERLDPVNVEEYLLYDFGADTMQSWVVPVSGNLNCDYGGTISLVTKSAVVLTPAGTFLNCYYLDRPFIQCMDAGLWGEWFAAGVGRVSYIEDNYAGVRNYVLKKSIIMTSAPAANNFPVIHSYQLEQNYPNPFNPITTIVFQILQKSSKIRF